MRWAVNGVLGWVEAQVTGACPEEFFNLCARQGLPFWRPRQEEPTRWTFRVGFWSWRRVRPLAEKSRCEVRVLRRGGLPGLVWQLRYRYALLAGLVVSLAAVGVLSRFVLTVRVSGNVTVPTGAILSQLRAQGVKPGAYGPGLDVRQISHTVILELPELCWMSINLHGTVADVVVREGDPRPELVDEDQSAHIVAKYPGIITKIQTTRGMQLVEKGDTVAAGDTLIGSWVDFIEPEGYNGDMGGMLVRAAGRVEARTWHTMKAAIPLEGEAKAFTGREKHRWSLEIFGHREKFYLGGGISYDKYDKINEYHTPCLPGGQSLPFSLCREVCREYVPEVRPVDRQRAETVLRDALERRLGTVAEPEEVRRVDWQTEERDGLLIVTLLAQCDQAIGVTVEE